MEDRRHVEHPYTRDLPRFSGGYFSSLMSQVNREVTWNKVYAESDGVGEIENVESVASMDAGDEVEYVDDEKRKKKRSMMKIYWPIITTGSGLFSDGYINNSIGTVSTCLSKIYGTQYSESAAIQNVSSIAFAGTVAGMLSFGYISDHYSRKLGMLLGNIILILFSILCSGAWGVGTTSTNAGGLFAAISAYRFFLGIGIGSEYPSGSTAAAEASALLPPKKRNRWFVWFTNFMIDFGFVVSAIVPLVLVKIFGEDNLQWVWRLTLGFGAIPPIALFFLRLKYNESKSFTTSKFNKIIPYFTVLKFYWFRTIIVSIIWFLYDFSSYAFGIYSSFILTALLTNNNGSDASLVVSFGWNVLFNVFYLPGSFLGAYAADYFGPRLTLCVGLFIQAMIGLGMTCGFSHLEKNIAGFTVVFGLFTTMGEFAVGDNVGLIASKSYATPVRGTLYSLSASIGKVGAFVGTYAFTKIIDNAGGSDTTNGLRAPFWVATALCLFSCVIGFFFLPRLDPQAIVEEDRKFLEYLESTGYDLASLGTQTKDAKDYEIEYSEELTKSNSGEKYL